MKFFIFFFIFISINAKKYRLFGEDDSSNPSMFKGNLLVDVDIYNRPYALPYLLRQLEQFQCPCEKCYFDLRLYRVYNSENENETDRIVYQWVDAMKHSSFGNIKIHSWAGKSADDRSNRLNDVLKRSSELDITYLAMFDSMIILLEPEKLLSRLISKDKPLMTPLLRSTKEMFTSTFYLDEQDRNGYYSYLQIYDRKKLGCFLIDGGIKDFYFFNFQHSQINDIFRKNYDFEQVQQQTNIDTLAKKNSIPMYVCNRENFGYIPAQFPEALFDEPIIEALYKHMLIEHQLNGPKQTYLPPISQSSLIQMKKSEEKTKFGLDEIYVINLLRRPDRRERLKATFDVLNISARFFDAVDGKFTIDQQYLEGRNIRLLPNYEDPYNRRPMNYGELGCFFSHYDIWQDMVKNNYVNGAMILEDDVRFDVYFKYKLEEVLSNRDFEWDLIFLGRKIMRPDEENYEEAFEKYLIQPSYSHWTVGYMLSLRGAKILVNENPLQKMLPVDEYLPIMYDHHPNEQWKSHFKDRSLKAFAFNPPVLTPTHYFGEPNYISDTENTTILGNVAGTEKFKVNSHIVSVDVATRQPVEKDEL